MFGLMSDIKKPDFSLDTPFCDFNFYPNVYPTMKRADKKSSLGGSYSNLREFLRGPSSPFSHRIFQTHELDLVGEFWTQLLSKNPHAFLEAKLQMSFADTEFFPFTLTKTLLTFDEKLAHHLENILKFLTLKDSGRSFVMLLRGNSKAQKSGDFIHLLTNLKEPALNENLRKNQARHVVIDDFRKTIMELMNLEPSLEQDDAHAINLMFEEVPEGRTCKEVGINSDSCTWT